MSGSELLRKIRALFQRGLVKRSYYAHNQRYVQLQLEAGEPFDDIEHFEPAGFTSGPLEDAEAVALAFNGNGSHTIALIVDDRRYKLEVKPGEVAIFNQYKDAVHIKDDRTIAVTAAVSVDINSPEVNCSGVVKAKDFVTHNGVSVNQHDHNETNGAKTNKANPS